MPYITHNLRLKQRRAHMQGNTHEVRRLTEAIKAIEQICPHMPGKIIVLPQDSSLRGTNDGPKYAKGGRLMMCSICGTVAHYEPPVRKS